MRRGTVVEKGQAHVLLVGTATLDLVFGLDHPPHADEEMRATNLRICRGGNAANSAVVLAGLGHAPEFLGVLADAEEAAVIDHDFDRAGVRYARCPRLPGRPPTSSIYLAGAARSIVHYRDLPELAAEHLTSLDLAGCDWLHLEGRNVIALEKMLVRVRQCYPSLPVSLELEKPRPGIDALFGLADLLVCSRGFSMHHGFGSPQQFMAWMQQQAPQADIVLAWGEAGAYGMEAGGEIVHAPARPPALVLDTLGAGDTFNAALIAARIGGESMVASLDHACLLAGRKCGRPGFDLFD